MVPERVRSNATDPKSGRNHANRPMLSSILSQRFHGGRRMARLERELSNELFEVLANWNTLLEHRESADSEVQPWT